MAVTRIRDNLYISDIDAVRTTDLDRFGIDRVITICQDNTSENVGCAYNHYDIPDDEHNYEIFEAAVDRLRDAWNDGERVLVHCHAGMSRSVCASAAAIAAEENIPVDSALYEIGQSRGIAPGWELKDSAKRYVGDHWNFEE